MKKIIFSSLIVSLLLSNQIELDAVDVSTDIGGGNTYTKTHSSTATGMELTQKDTPQSVSVITQKQLEDRAINNLDDALKTATGINVSKDASGVVRYQSRGFYMDYIQVDGINENVKTQSLFNEKIDTKAPTDMAIYEGVEIVRGATGLMQSNGEPGGTVNLLRKKPTHKFQHLGEILFDENKKRRLMLDFSGALNDDGTIRARAVGSASQYDTFRDRVDGDSKMIYSTVEFDIKNSSILGLGGMYQNTNEVPVMFGVPLPYIKPTKEEINKMSYGEKNSYNQFYKNYQPAHELEKNTYLGANWSNTETDKYNIFTTFDHYFENDWHLGIDLSYTKIDSLTELAEFGDLSKISHNSKYGMHKGFVYNTMRGIMLDKEEEQLGFKIDLNGDYELFNQEHQFYIAYNYNREKTKYNYKTRELERQGYCKCADDGLVKKTKRGIKYKMCNRNYTGNICVTKDDPRYEKFKAEFQKIYNDDGELLADEKYYKTYKIAVDPHNFKGNEYEKPIWTDPDNFDFLRDLWARNTEVEKKLKTNSITASTRINPINKLHFLLGGSYTWYDYKKKWDLRYDKISMEQKDDRGTIYNDECTINNQSENCKIINENNRKFTPFLGVTFDITPSHSIYASYTEIFKHQEGESKIFGNVTKKNPDYEPDSSDPEEEFITEEGIIGYKGLKPINGKSYEIGYKALLNDDKLNLSIAIFKIEQENMVIYKAGDQNNFYETKIEPVGKVESKGIEFEIAGEALENLHMLVGYTYNKSKYKNEINLNKSGENYSKHTPEHMFKLYASYKIPSTKFTIGGGITSQSSTKGLNGLKQSGYTIYDAHINYQVSNNISVNLIGTNLGDKKYFENNIDRTRLGNNFYGEPRKITIKFDWKF
ncbi:TonB-dependent siderophore receptor [Campylobacter sp. FMV-PI01]|uniref:TonB-dependent siderophore receptor n=1 Tax=Campylobacter portucalensis TaxID=2608384 RepID=A0A6L5WI93_9BACT|nr:TonB-dependent receptor [Campylobacter portucalensis]MSN96192.1 TonB-dependent siderophore receptor [Campylobacter portucalensis]